VIIKGTYVFGGRKIIFCNGKTAESNSVSKKILDGIA
jgi:hypothetical protein